jgi:type VI secretion system secreted protein VgrG
LPEHKTRTVLRSKSHKGEGNNELSFEDESGREQVYLHAQRDLVLDTGHDRTECIGHDSHLTVAGNRFDHIRGSRHHTVAGEKRERVAQDHSFHVSGSLHLKMGRAWLSESGTELHIKAGQKVVLEAGAEITLKAGGSFVKIDASGVALAGAAIKLNAGGSPGRGAGATVRTPERPELVAGAAETVGPESLAEVGQRPNADPEAQIRALQDGKALTAICSADTEPAGRGSDA